MAEGRVETVFPFSYGPKQKSFVLYEMAVAASSVQFEPEFRLDIDRNRVSDY